MDEVKNLVNYTIDNNVALENSGKVPVAIALEASAGIGKTSILKQIAEERGMTFSKISLHELDEACDLLGYPQTEYECQMAKVVKAADGAFKKQILPGTVWLNAKQLAAPDKGTILRQTGKTRMGYAKPAWVPEYNENGTLCVLDDYVRANPQLLQSSMELILTQRYTSWSLPKKTTIVLTNNPDDGNSNVQSLDEAQKTRFLNFSLSWSQDAWAEWAEKSGMDGRCINFALTYASELFNADEDGNRICNPRSFSMFADMISGVKDWDDIDSLSFITLIAKGCFKDDDGKFSKMFTSFLRNKMHQLIQPNEMLLGDWKGVQGKLEAVLYDSGETYRADIASLLERRFSNYVGTWLSSDGQTPIVKVKDRLTDFIDAEPNGGKRLFTKDMFYHMVKTITSKNRNQTNRLCCDPKIMGMLS